MIKLLKSWIVFFGLILHCIDSTSQITSLLSDTHIGSTGGWDKKVGILNDNLIFQANDGINGNELWISDGTPNGTILLKDCNPGSGSSIVGQVINFGNILLMEIDDGTWGNELWRTDGTTNGTYMIKDIYPGTNSSLTNLASIWEKNGFIYFIANDGIHGVELWMTDGTAMGTNLLLDINPGVSSTSFQIEGFHKFNGKLFFPADDGVHGTELWSTDGTINGTQILRDLNLGINSSTHLPGMFFQDCGTGFFYQGLDSIQGWSLNYSDGTFNGTMELTSTAIQITGNYFIINNLFIFPNSIFITYRKELWKSDGTVAGTALIKDINNDSLTSSLQNYNLIWNNDSNACFIANDGIHGDEPYITNGTNQGTFLLKDINPGNSSSDPRKAVFYSGDYYFSAFDSLTGRELWKSDGTTQGTNLVKDINPGVLSGYGGDSLFSFYGYLYFAANNQSSGTEIWRTDGSSTGTQLFYEATAGPLSTTNFIRNGFRHLVNGDIFPIETTSLGVELTRFDFSNGNNSFPLDINPGSSDGFGGWFQRYDSTFTPYDLLFGLSHLFIGENSTGNWELWRTDGSQQNTVPLNEINPGANGSQPTFVCTISNKTILSAFNDTTGRELFVLDLDTNLTNIKSINSTQLNIFPIPAHNSFWVSTNNSNTSIITISLSNIFGDLVFKHFFYENNSHKYLVDVSTLSSGCYLIKTETNSGTFVNKILIN